MPISGAWVLLLGLFITTLLTTACQTQPQQIFIDVDGGRQALTTEATTVREALAEARVVLGPLDRVQPDLYAQLEPGLVIVVIRTAEEIETRREVVPFEHQVVTNEALATGETRLVQLGANGEDEISIRVVYENGQEVSRTEISRVTVIQPIPEILVVGPEGELPSVPVAGSVAYLANGNAWLMRNSSGSRRALTSDGNLDGRVFDLSPDGRRLVYTTKLTDDIESPLNELWLASTTIVGEQPITVGVQGVLEAKWSPVLSQSLIAYTTAERIAGPPGWRANNDLWLLDLLSPKPKPMKLLAANSSGLYAWWGTNFTWAPDGTRLAYARADQIGLLNLTTRRPISGNLTTLIDFTPLKTFSEWVWVPQLSWSPDGQFIAATVHGPPLASESAEESQVFDLWLIGVDSGISAKVVEQVGMWANPAWSRAGIAFGQAIEPLQSANSRYRIQLMDKDGSNKRQLFPFREELGVQFPELVWSPTGQELLFTYNGNLYLIGDNGSPPKQLTVDGQVSQPHWVSEAPIITYTTGLTNVTGITGSVSITTGSRPTGEATLAPTVSITGAAGQVRGTPTPAVPGQATLTPPPTPPTATPAGGGAIQPGDASPPSVSPDVEENKGNKPP